VIMLEKKEDRVKKKVDACYIGRKKKGGGGGPESTSMASSGKREIGGGGERPRSRDCHCSKQYYEGRKKRRERPVKAQNT